MVKALTVRCASEKNRMGRGFEKEWTVMNYDAQQFDDDHEDDQFMGPRSMVIGGVIRYQPPAHAGRGNEQEPS